MNDIFPDPIINDKVQPSLRKTIDDMRAAQRESKPKVKKTRHSILDPYKNCKNCGKTFDSRIEQMYYAYTGKRKNRVYLCSKCEGNSKSSRKSVYEKYYHRMG